MKTIQRIVGKPPFRAVQKLVDGGPKMALIREGSPDEKSPEDYARMMQAYIDGKFKPKVKVGEMTQEEIKRIVARTKRNFGCLVQFAKLWGADAPAILRSVCGAWTDFQAIVHMEIDLAIDEAKEAGEERGNFHLKKAYPDPPQLRWFAAWRPRLVLDLHMTVLQAGHKGAKPNTTLTNPLFKDIVLPF